MDGLLTINKISHHPLTSLIYLVNQTPWQQSLWTKLTSRGLPDETDEDWRYTPLSPIQFQTLNSAPETDDDEQIQQLLNKFSCSINAYRIVMINGKYSFAYSDHIHGASVQQVTPMLSRGMEIPSLFIHEEFLAGLAEVSARHNLNICISNGIKIKKPIYIINVLLNNSENQSATYRIHLNLGKNSKADVIEHHINHAEKQAITLSRTTISVGDNAHYQHIKMIESGPEGIHFGHNDIHLGKYCHVDAKTFLLNGRLIRNTTSASIDGEGSELTLDSLAMPKNQQTHDTRTHLLHNAPYCQSRQLHKLIASHNANSVFDGIIKVGKLAHKTDGQMDNKNLLLSEQAQVNCKPQLEIYTDDVKCSHGSTTGQIDNEQVYYLQSRGISKADAEKMITTAFAFEVSDNIANLELRHVILNKIDQYLPKMSV